MDRVVVEKLAIRARVGVTDAERAAPQRLRVDVELATGLEAAGESDDLDKTVDYGAVVGILEEVAATTESKLLETLAERMAQALFDRFGPTADRRAEAPGVVAGVKIRVVKLEPPLDASLEGIGVEVERVPTRRAAGAGEPGFRR